MAMMKTLGAGATLPLTVDHSLVKDIDTGRDIARYRVSSDFYKTLLLMSAGAFPAYRTDHGALASRAAAQALRSMQAQPRPIQADRQRVLPDQRQEQQFDPRPDQNNLWQDAADRQAAPSRRPAAPPALPAGPQGEPMYQPSEQDMPRVARSEPGQRAEPRPRQDPLAEGLGSRIRAELIGLAGLHPWNDNEIQVAIAMGENSVPEQALRRLPGRAPHLARLVDEALQEARHHLNSAYEQLRADRAHDKVYLDVLETEAGKLMHLMPVLMLSPMGPYQRLLENMVYDMEPQAADGSLSPADKLIFAHAKQQIEALTMLPDGRPDRLARVAQIIERYDERLSSHSTQIDQDRRTLN